MSIVVSILNQKGGCGKTTLSQNLAHAFSLESTVLLVDSDPQGSTRDWNNCSDVTHDFAVVGLDRPSLYQDLKQLNTSHEYTIIDGCPSIQEMSIAAIKLSDVILIPVTPSPYDVWAVDDLIQIIKARQSVLPTLKAAFIISRTIKNTKLSSEIVTALESYELPILQSSTTQRVIYPQSASEGKTVLDLSKSSPSTREILAIRDEIKQLLHTV